jgi:hypothetical protein
MSGDRRRRRDEPAERVLDDALALHDRLELVVHGDVREEQPGAKRARERDAVGDGGRRRLAEIGGNEDALEDDHGRLLLAASYTNRRVYDAPVRPPSRRNGHGISDVPTDPVDPVCPRMRRLRGHSASPRPARAPPRHRRPDQTGRGGGLVEAASRGVSARSEEAGLPWMDVWASATSGNPYMRTLVTPVATLAELDDRTLLQKALGDSRAEDLLERNRQMVESVHTYIMRPRPDLGFGTAPARRSIGLISKITVAPGRAEEFEQLLKQGVAESLKEANVSSFVVLQVVYGGDPNQYRTVLSFDTHEQVASGHGDPIPWLETHGQRVGTDGLARQPGSPILSLERTIITYMPNLSFRPEPR